jgi:glycosyltransferase involved in cell wall biosynthesis
MIKYVIITPARNEEANIRRLLDSVVAQTHLPERYVVVDDNSTDRTGEIVAEYARQHPWIELVRRGAKENRSFAAKVQAFNAGYERVRGLAFEVVGNVDADLSFEPGYFEFLMARFEEDPKLGVAGTPFKQDDGYDSASDSFEGENYVAGGCQLFRAACFREVGGYVPNPAGGIDWIAVMAARMKGWTVRCFRERRYHHYRPLGTAEKSRLRASFEYGERAYYLGGSPIWHLFRVLYRIPRKPFLLASLALLWGYCWAAIKRTRRPVSPEMIRFHRRDQMNKLRTIFATLFHFRKVDSFQVATQAEHSRP